MTDFDDAIAQPIMDGHVLYFVWERDAIKINHVDCPNEDTPGICNRRRAFCVVERYLSAYGFELNIGTAPLKDGVEIAWIPVYGESDLDSEFASIWVIPIDDEDFREEYFPDGEDDFGI